MDLTGNWTGFYTYGTSYPEEYWGKKSRFSVKLSHSGGRIKGFCVDEFTEAHFDAPATIEGTLLDKDISFIKKYPGLLIVDENNILRADISLPSMEIHYKGKLRRKLFSQIFFFEGTWKISGSYLDENGVAMNFTNEGDWELFPEE